KPNGEAEPPPDEGVDQKEGAGALREFREWIESSQQKLEDWQKKMDERVRHVVEGLSPFATLSKEVAALTTRLAEIERRLDKLEGDRGAPQKSSEAANE